MVAEVSLYHSAVAGKTAAVKGSLPLWYLNTLSIVVVRSLDFVLLLEDVKLHDQCSSEIYSGNALHTCTCDRTVSFSKFRLLA